MSLNQLWVEKYRPQSITEYVFTDSQSQELVTHWLTEGMIPHVLLYGPPGTGKTTLAKILINNLGIDETDVLLVNGSKEGRKIDWLRTKLETFCSTMPFGIIKVVLIDEADYLNKDSVQPAMRSLMEDYSENVRFIMTCNYVNKIIPPLRSRCQEIKIEKTDITEFTARAATVLVAEGINFDLESLDRFVSATYPDLRKCLNLLQANSSSGQLRSQHETTKITSDYMLEAVELFQSQRHREARDTICKNLRVDDVEHVYRWAYDNLGLWSSSLEGQDQAIIIIGRGLVNHASSSDPEINLSATLTELISIGQ